MTEAWNPGEGWIAWLAATPPAGVLLEAMREVWGMPLVCRLMPDSPEADPTGLFWRLWQGDVADGMNRLSCVYDRVGTPMFGSPPFQASILDLRVYCFTICPHGQAWSGTPTRMWFLPIGPRLSGVPVLIMGEFVAAVDRGECVIMHGSEQVQIEHLGRIVVSMTGGGHG